MVWFTILNIVLMLVVGGLLLALHVRLNALKKHSAELPKSAEAVRKTLVTVQQNLQQIKTDLKMIDPLVTEGNRTAQDLDFMLHRAKQILEKLDAHQQPALLPTENFKLPVANAGSVKNIAEGSPPPKSAAEKLKARLQTESAS